jgi:transglycosylase-like protein
VPGAGTRRGTGAIALAFATAATVASLTASVATSQGSLQSNIDSTRNQVGSLAAGLESKHGRLVVVAAQARQAAEREARLSTLLAHGRARAARLAERERVAERRLDATRDRLRRALGALGERLVAIYKGDTPDFTAVFLDAEGFDDLVTRAEYLQLLHDSDVRLATRVRELRSQEEVEVAQARRAHDRAEAFADRLALARARIGAVRARAEAEATTLRQAGAAQSESLAGLRNRLDDLTAQLQRAGYSSGEARKAAGRALGGYAIPESIVMCESGGNYGARNPGSGAYGAYQILPSTAKAHDCDLSTPRGQDSCAAKIWSRQGSSAWVCAG